jgi:folate-dependent phosphoribosylglycinamide formyltransferase PurN
MNICFYTSEKPNATSELNISHLVHNRPQHNYSFLNIASMPVPRTGLLDRLKTVYGEWRFDDGRFDFGRDLKLLDKRLLEKTKALKRSEFRTGSADAVNDEKSVRFLNELKPDILIQAGAGILKQNTFALSTKATINLHHGIAPDIRGIESTFWCMVYGLRDKIGVTCHLIDETLDTGAIVLQKSLLTDSTTFADIQLENLLLGRDVLLESVDLLCNNQFAVKSTGEVSSYYFGLPNSFLYSDLKKNHFQPLKDISEKAFKMKQKNVLEFY